MHTHTHLHTHTETHTHTHTLSHTHRVFSPKCWYQPMPTCLSELSSFGTRVGGFNSPIFGAVMHAGFQEKKPECLKGEGTIGHPRALPPCVPESADCRRKYGFGRRPSQHSRKVAARREAGPLVPLSSHCSVPGVPRTCRCKSTTAKIANSEHERSWTVHVAQRSRVSPVRAIPSALTSAWCLRLSRDTYDSKLTDPDPIQIRIRVV